MKYTKDTDSTFEYELLNSNITEELHCHSRIEIIHALKKNIRLRVDMGKVVYDVYPGDYAIIRSADIHRIFTIADAELEIVHIPVSFQDMSGGVYVKNSFVIPKDAAIEDGFSDIIDGIFSCLSKENLAESVKKSLSSSLCNLLMSLYSKRRTTISVGNDSSEMLVINDGNISLETMQKFDKALEYINENFTDSKINLSKLSGVSELNKTFLSSLFPRLLGRNFNDYIHYLRINYALELFCSTEKNISEVAFACGFETIRSFNNVFKSVMGITPSHFLKSVSGKFASGIDTGISGIGSDIFGFNWTSNVDVEKDFENNCMRIICNETTLKLWCHLRVRMVFFAGKTYKISCKARPLFNAVGDKCDNAVISCSFYFRDKKTGIDHHGVLWNGNASGINNLEDGWCECTFEYKMPDYYVPSIEDSFSVYSNPVGDFGVSFEVKDISVTHI